MEQKLGNVAGNEPDEAMIEEVMRHLDAELNMGVMRMSVVMDEQSQDSKTVSHKCCHMYGRPANETVGLLDMYTDMAHRNADRE